jgi:DNA-binding NarL/FixJ family response regulator
MWRTASWCRSSALLNTMESRKTVTLIVPSDIIVRGLESILADQPDFIVQENLVDCSKASEARLRSLSPDLVIIDPLVFDYQSRKDGRVALAELCDASVIAIEGPAVTDEIIKQYDGAISLYDDAAGVVRKLQSAVESRQPESGSDGDELSAREKEILVCVAQGMLNKEIADKFSLSIYTVITHRKNITRKTGIKTVAGLTVYAILNNLIDINSIQ